MQQRRVLQIKYVKMIFFKSYTCISWGSLSCFHNSHFCFIYCRKKFVQTKLWSFQNNENLLEQIVLLLHYSIKMKDKQFNAASVGYNHVLFIVHIAIHLRISGITRCFHSIHNNSIQHTGLFLNFRCWDLQLAQTSHLHVTGLGCPTDVRVFCSICHRTAHVHVLHSLSAKWRLSN